MVATRSLTTKETDRGLYMRAKGFRFARVVLKWSSGLQFGKIRDMVHVRLGSCHICNSFKTVSHVPKERDTSQFRGRGNALYILQGFRGDTSLRQSIRVTMGKLGNVRIWFFEL